MRTAKSSIGGIKPDNVRCDAASEMIVTSPTGLPLPSISAPLGNYERGRIIGNLGYLSGQFPIVDGALAFTGALGAQLTMGEGMEAASIAAANAVAQINHLIAADWGRLSGLLRVDCYLATANDFDDGLAVLDAASARFHSLLADKGRHARSATFVDRLPLHAPIELVVTFAVL